MANQKDFNKLKAWLEPKLYERGLTVEDLARKAKISRTAVYLWLADISRPRTQTCAKIVHVLTASPILKNSGKSTQEVKLEDMLAQFVERKAGRPEGSGSGVRSVTARK